MRPTPSPWITRRCSEYHKAAAGCCCCGDTAQQQQQKQQQVYESSAAAARTPRGSNDTAAAAAAGAAAAAASPAAACCSPLAARGAFLLGLSRVAPVPSQFTSRISSSSSHVRGRGSDGRFATGGSYGPELSASWLLPPQGAAALPSMTAANDSSSSSRSSSRCLESSSSSSGSSLRSLARRLLWQLHVAAVGSVSLAVWEAALVVNEGLSAAWGRCLSAAAAAAAAGGRVSSSCCCQSLAASLQTLRTSLQQQQLLLQQRRAARASAISQLWAKVALTLGGFRPRVFGAENAAALGGPRGAPCLVVSNHCALIDIAITGGFLPLQHIRFISKHEVFAWPVIGRAMREIGVVGFERNCLSGTLRLIRQLGGVVRQHRAAKRQQGAEETPSSAPCLNAPVFLGFPEGRRARDGRLKPPKLGLFHIAQRLGLTVLPVSIVGAHKVQPVGCLLPVPSDSPLELHVHPAVNVCGRPVEEAATEVWNAIIRGLPPDQQPLSPIRFEEGEGEEEEEAAGAAAAAAGAAAAGTEPLE
ncbi:hypothetical protein Efla_006557 [Eimeria flavescens]